MKNFGLILMIGAFIVGCGETSDQVETDMIVFPEADGNYSGDLPVLDFIEPVFNFGKTLEGDILSHSYEFVNSGKTELIITSVEPSCGCTVAKDWPKEPIPPGGKGAINVDFNTEKRAGMVDKVIHVMANTAPAKTLLTIKGEVIGPQNNN
ncbi:MAG: DUF1573 domain-containing protein, partial [Bacteroidota bacterium]